MRTAILTYTSIYLSGTFVLISYYLKIVKATRSAVPSTIYLWYQPRSSTPPVVSTLGTQVKIKTLNYCPRLRNRTQTDRKEGTKDHADCKQTLASPLPPP
jgi:hypothetical protein